MFIFSRTFDIVTSAIGTAMIAAGFFAVTAVAGNAGVDRVAPEQVVLEQDITGGSNNRLLVLVPGLGVTATGTIPAMEILASEPQSTAVAKVARAQ